MGSKCSRNVNFEVSKSGNLIPSGANFSKTNLNETKKKPRSGDVQLKASADPKGALQTASLEKKEPALQEVVSGPAQAKRPRSNDPPRLSQLKMAHEPPKVKIDQKKIMANMREKKALCNDIALIGTGGKAQLNGNAKTMEHKHKKVTRPKTGNKVTAQSSSQNVVSKKDRNMEEKEHNNNKSKTKLMGKQDLAEVDAMGTIKLPTSENK